MSFDKILHGDFRRPGFGDYQDAQGGWQRTPLIRFAGETDIHNPSNDAVYPNEAAASAAVGGHTVTVFANQASWATYLAGFGGDVHAALLNPPASVDDPDPLIEPGPALAHPDLAAIVEGFYQKYLHRASDPTGLDFWVQVIINGGGNGKANAEQGFRVQAVNDHIYTDATLPAGTYVATGGSPIDGGPNPDVPPAEISEGGLFDGVQAKIEAALAGLSETTGLSVRTLELGAVALGVGALMYFNSDGGTKRKR